MDTGSAIKAMRKSGYSGNIFAIYFGV